MRFDATGKVTLDHIYTQPDPRAYFSTLRTLDYHIPQLAKPYFLRLITEYRQARQVAEPTVLDIGCSYGINAALLRLDATMDELYERYGTPAAAALDRDSLLAADQELVRSRTRRPHLTFVGLDSSRPALEYALAAGFLSDALHADLEHNDPTEHQRALLSGVDIVVSTGCIGYVTERTIARIAESAGDRLPWMAHLVLRMFSFDPIADCLAGFGYTTEVGVTAFPQRRFASVEEQSLVLSNLAAAGIDPTGREADGNLYATLYVSRPPDTPGCAVIDPAATMSSTSPPIERQGSQ